MKLRSKTFEREEDGKIFVEKDPEMLAPHPDIVADDGEEDTVKWVGDDDFVSMTRGFGYREIKESRKNMRDSERLDEITCKVIKTLVERFGKRINEVSSKQIKTLRDEAAEAGDEEQVTLCDKALRGDKRAAAACARALSDAEAMQESELNEVSPEGWEGTVKAMKKHPEINNPWALSYSMKDKGYKSHYSKSGKRK